MDISRETVLGPATGLPRTSSFSRPDVTGGVVRGDHHIISGLGSLAKTRPRSNAIAPVRTRSSFARTFSKGRPGLFGSPWLRNADLTDVVTGPPGSASNVKAAPHPCGG